VGSSDTASHPTRGVIGESEPRKLDQTTSVLRLFTTTYFISHGNV
jgi:hypothetical protein